MHKKEVGCCSLFGEVKQAHSVTSKKELLTVLL